MLFNMIKVVIDQRVSVTYIYLLRNAFIHWEFGLMKCFTSFMSSSMEPLLSLSRVLKAPTGHKNSCVFQNTVIGSLEGAAAFWLSHLSEPLAFCWPLAPTLHLAQLAARSSVSEMVNDQFRSDQCDHVKSGSVWNSPYSPIHWLKLYHFICYLFEIKW